MEERKELLEKEIEADEKKWEKELSMVENLMSLRKKKYEDEGQGVFDDLKKITGDLETLQGDNPQVFADVNAEIVTEVIESWTGIPVGNMSQDELTMLTNLEQELEKRVVGQRPCHKTNSRRDSWSQNRDEKRGWANRGIPYDWNKWCWENRAGSCHC